MKKTIYSIIASVIALPTMAYAQNKPLVLENPLGGAGVDSIPALIDKITTFLVEAAAPIVTIMILVGAFKMLTAAGNENKFQEGKKTITYAIIGMAVVLLSKGVTSIIKDFLGVH